jgi:chromosome segregation ATPase
LCVCQKLEEEIDDHDGAVRQLATTGKELQNHCKGEDVKLVQMKIDDAQKRFSELRSRVEDSLEQMEEALPLAQHFQEAHQGFLQWANRVEPELRTAEHALAESEETIEVGWVAAQKVHCCVNVALFFLPSL